MGWRMETLFNLDSEAPRRRGAFMVRNLRMVSDVVCESPVNLVETPDEAVAFMADAWGQFPEREQVWIIFLNARNRPLGRQLLTVGTDRQCLVTARDVLRSVLLAGAAGFILLHNHPSGDPSPSSADSAITRQIRSAAEAVDVRFFDHVIVGDPRFCPLGVGYFSFRRSGML